MDEHGESYPFEKPDEGLYFHHGSAILLTQTEWGRESDSSPVYYVAVEDFMDVQKKYDDLRRGLAILNASKKVRAVPGMDKILDDLGFTEAHGEATRGIITEVLGEVRR